MPRWDKEKTANILTQVNQVLGEQPDLLGHWTPLAETLNERGILNTVGKEWSAAKIQQFMIRQAEKKAPRKPQQPVVTDKVEGITRQEALVAQPQTPVTSLLTPVTRADMEEIARRIFREEFQQMVPATAATTELRPVFQRGKTIYRSIRLDERLVRLAEKLAVEQRARTGGTVNGLIELLLWEYCSRPSWMLQSAKDTDQLTLSDKTD